MSWHPEQWTRAILVTASMIVAMCIFSACGSRENNNQTKIPPVDDQQTRTERIVQDLGNRFTNVPSPAIPPSIIPGSPPCGAEHYANQNP